MADDGGSAFISGEKRDEHGKFIVPPKSPGRPKGARNKLGEQFLQDMLADWEEHGTAVIEAVRADKPDQYLKVVASVLPKELNVKVNDFDELSDEQLARQFAAIAAQLANAGISIGEGNASAGSAEPAAGISTLQ